MNDYPQRKLIRLQGYDYANAGCYFITVCIHQRMRVLSEIVKASNVLTDAGDMISTWILKLPEKFPNVELGEWVVMPNHIHLIIMLNGISNQSIPDIMDWFKTMTTNAYIRGVRQQGWLQFDRHFWQRSYHDRIIRNREEHEKIAQYILDNPKTWVDDRFYVA